VSKRSNGLVPVAALLLSACGTTSGGGSNVATSGGAGSTSGEGSATTGGSGFVLGTGGANAGAGGANAGAGSSSAGAGGSSAGAGGSATLVACEQCAATKCAATLGACNAVANCSKGLDFYYQCLSDPFQPVTTADCGMNLIAYAGAADPASALHACMTGAQSGGDGRGCAYTCLGNDSGAGGTGGAAGSCVRAAASDGQCASFMASAPLAWACPDVQTATQFQVAKSGCWSVNFIGALGFCCPN